MKNIIRKYFWRRVKIKKNKIINFINGELKLDKSDDESDEN